MILFHQQSNNKIKYLLIVPQTKLKNIYRGLSYKLDLISVDARYIYIYINGKNGLFNCVVFKYRQYTVIVSFIRHVHIMN